VQSYPGGKLSNIPSPRRIFCQQQRISTPFTCVDLTSNRWISANSIVLGGFITRDVKNPVINQDFRPRGIRVLVDFNKKKKISNIAKFKFFPDLFCLLCFLGEYSPVV
jgi:hypothetical protein